MLSILLAEDDKSLATMIQKYLEAHTDIIGETTIVWTESGRVARNLILGNPDKFNLIITDNQLGEERNFWGKEIIREIRHRGPKNIKIILMSSESVTQYEDGQAEVFFPKNSELMQSIIEQIAQWFK
jgi:CheY-like chemotaxis protein